MLTSMDMYWLTRLDPIRVLFAFMAVFGFAGAVMGIGFGLCEKVQAAFRLGVVTFGFFVFAVIGMVFVPSTREMVAIYVVPAIANNEQVRSIPDTALKLADEYLKQKLDELVGEKPKK